MSYLVCSDLHGSQKYTSMLFKYIDEHNIDNVIILGDLYYNGPRNDLPENYSSKDVVKILNEHKDKIIAIKGNCDAEVDEMVSMFPLTDLIRMDMFDKRVIMSHGHQISFDNLPVENFDIFMQGHTHKSRLDKINGTIFINPGSVSLPKDEHHSFVLINEKNNQLIDLISMDVLKEISL